MISPKIQKDVVSCAAVKTTNSIIREMDDSLFFVLIDESRNISTKIKWLLYYIMWIRMDMWSNILLALNISLVLQLPHLIKKSLDNMLSRLELSSSILRG